MKLVAENERLPTLGVRVHELKPTRDSGAVIRTPSVAKHEKVAASVGDKSGSAEGAPGDHPG